MREIEGKRSSRGKAVQKIIETEPPLSNDSKLEHLATAAYFKAEARGFAPGRELDDWLSAEAEMGGRNIQ